MKCTAFPLDGVCFGDDLCRRHACDRVTCHCSESTDIDSGFSPEAELADL